MKFSINVLKKCAKSENFPTQKTFMNEKNDFDAKKFLFIVYLIFVLKTICHIKVFL